MHYQPKTAVWEITVQCNMRCKHCGSSCDNHTGPAELTTDEALALADDIGRLKLSYITLSGGEPLMRKDWPLIAARLKQNNVVPNMITNGWFFDESVVKTALEVGLSNIAISIDGLEETHDFMRCKGAFARAIRALSLMKQGGLPSSVVTTIHKRNIGELEHMLQLFEQIGLYSWQLQIGAPMGNLAQHPELLMDPAEVQVIIDFAHRHLKDSPVLIYLADCVGYYTQKETEIHEAHNACQTTNTASISCWAGCHAGTQNFGIKACGDIIGCTSIREDSFIEGNIRTKSLVDIWQDEDAFAWNRKFNPQTLTGFCGRCGYGSLCRAGCSVTKLNFEQTLRENRYCAFRVAMEELSRKIPLKPPHEMVAMAQRSLEKDDYQVAEIILVKTIERYPGSAEVWELLGYTYFQMEKYQLCRGANEAVIAFAPDRAYARKGLGLALWKLGYIDEAISQLKQAVALAPSGFNDPLHDLHVVLCATGRHEEAAVVQEALQKLSA